VWTYTATYEDLAGNVSPVSNTLAITFDSIAPVAPILDLPASQDSGSSNTDNVTNVGTWTFFANTAGQQAITHATEVAPTGRTLTYSYFTDASGGQGGEYFYPDTAGGPQGVWTYTATYEDLAGNVSTVSNTLKITYDSIAPTVVPPANVTAEATSSLGATVTYAAATVTDASPTTVSYSKPSGSTFAIGTTTVTVTATDLAGNTTTATFTVTVRDTTPPVIAVSSPVNGATYDVGLSVAFSYTATDAVSGVATQSAKLDGTTIANGSTISTGTLTAGTHTIVITATDGRGNTATKTVTFTIKPTPAGLSNLINAGVASGKIAPALRTTLIALLTVAQAAIAAGQPVVAQLALGTFVLTVSVGVARRQIDPTLGAQLIAFARAITP
jgi:hypothetical protein